MHPQVNQMPGKELTRNEPRDKTNKIVLSYKLRKLRIIRGKNETTWGLRVRIFCAFAAGSLHHLLID